MWHVFFDISDSLFYFIKKKKKKKTKQKKKAKNRKEKGNYTYKCGAQSPTAALHDQVQPQRRCSEGLEHAHRKHKNSTKRNKTKQKGNTHPNSQMPSSISNCCTTRSSPSRSTRPRFRWGSNTRAHSASLSSEVSRLCGCVLN